MASNVSSALGTQRQFSAMPKDTYEQRLASLPSHVAVTTDSSNDGLLLAKSLGVLGDSLVAYGLQKEKDKEKIGIAEAERIIAGRSEDDIKKLTAIEMINNYGQFELADNPYAVTTIEKMRGKYLGAKAKEEYDAEVIAKEGYAKTASEEAARYDKFVRERYQEYTKTTSDEQAFQKGFFDNHIVNQLEKTHQQIKAKSEEYHAIAIGSTQASLSEIVAKSIGLKPEELVDEVNKVFAETRLSGVDIPTRVDLAKQFLKEFAQSTGDYSKIDHIAKNVVIGVDARGQQVKLGEVVPLGDIQKMAELRTTQIFDERVQKSLKELQDMPSMAEVNAKYEEWKTTDHHWFNVMLPYRDNIFQFHIKKEQQKKIAEFNEQVKQHARKMSFEILENQWNAYQVGHNKDANGYVVAASYGDLPKFEYTYVDADGNTKTKKYEWNKEDVNAYVDHKLNQIKAENLTPEQRAAKVMKLLTWPPAKHYADSLKMVIQNALDTLTVDKLPTDEQGNPQLTEQVQDAVQMYRTDPEAFQHLFGSQTTKDIEAIQLLSQATNDVKQGVALFATTRDKRKDPEFVKTIKGEIANRLTSSRLKDFLAIDGSTVNLNTALAVNQSVFKRVEALAETLGLAGIPADRAVEMTLNKVKETTYVYRDTAIPRTIFNGIMTENKAAIGKQALDYFLWKFCQDTGTDPAYVTTEYDIDRGVFRINDASGHFVAYNINDITYSGNYILEKMASGEWGDQGRDITLDEAIDARRQKWDGQELPEGFYWGI